jgi:hypothetical protein
MKSIDRITGKCLKITESRSKATLGAQMMKLLDRASREVIAQYSEVLVKKPLVYVVPAVWGVGLGSPMDDLQREMNTVIDPVLKEVMKSLDLQGLTPDQEFAIQYFIRGYVVTKLLFMIQTLIVQSCLPAAREPEGMSLASLQPVGSA